MIFFSGVLRMWRTGLARGVNVPHDPSSTMIGFNPLLPFQFNLMILRLENPVRGTLLIRGQLRKSGVFQQDNENEQRRQ